MSMLAEKKRKQKWSLNPRGKAWSEDGNKFGQKLLEKMGWQTGKGLGAKEDGITEHIKVPYKNDSKGMGFKESDQWTEHESNFTALLESLTGTAVDTDVTLTSLEKKSRVSRVRLHYHKFTKGKDLSSRSEKELANIFGKKTLKKVEKKVEDVPVAKDEPKANDMLINSGSMADYFKNKLPGLGKLSKKAESESEEDVRIGFGFKTTSEEKPSFKRKLQVEDAANTFSPRKKVKSGDNGFVNPAFNPLNNQVVVERHNLETILESSLENVNDSNIEESEHKSESFTDSTLEAHAPKKKKKKLKEYSENTYEYDNISCETISNSENTSKLSQYEVKFPLKKKKKLNTPSENTDRIDCHASESSKNLESTEICETAELKKKKKKKSTRTENGHFEDEPEQIAELKKKKKKSKSCGIDNPNFEDYNLNTSEDNPGKSKKYKRKNLQNGIENLNFEDQVRDEPEVSQSKEFQQRNSKKSNDAIQTSNLNGYSNTSRKHKNKNPQEGIDNPNFKDYIVNTSQNNQENVYNGKSTKHKNLQNGIENPGFEDHFRSELDDSQEMHQNGEFQPRKSKIHSSEVQDLNCNNSDTLNGSSISDAIQTTNTKSKKKKKKNPSEDVIHNETCLPVKVKSKKKSDEGIDVTFEEQDRSENILSAGNPYEVKLKNKKKQSKSEVLSHIIEESQITSDIIDYSDLMLNTVTTPVMSTPQLEPKIETNRVKRRKSVRFNDVPLQHIIPNNEQLRIMEEGIDNVNFNEIEMHLQENMEKISNTIDRFQAEIENDINEKKVEEIMVGEMDKPDGPNEKLPDGTRLKFKYVQFNSKMPNYFSGNVGPKKSYKHLIKGDIIVKFKNTNLHEIQGYATKKKPKG